MSADPRKPFGEFFRVALKEWRASLGSTPYSDKMLEEAYERTHDAWHEVRKPKRKVKPAAPVSEVEAIYQAYPLHVGKADAVKAIARVLLKLDAKTLLERVQRYASCVNRWPPHVRYTEKGRDTCPHPATWFNRGSYDDDPNAWLVKGMAPEKKAEDPLAEPPGWLEYMRTEFPGWGRFRDPRPCTWVLLSNMDKATVLDALKNRK